MEIAERRNLVAELLNRAQGGPEEEAALLNADPEAPADYIRTHLRRYVLKKYMLPLDCPEDNIRVLAQMSLQVTLKLDKKALRELDKAAPCNSATSESTKKVLLLYAVQRDLHLPENPAELAAVQTVTELADYVLRVRRDAKARINSSL